MGRALLRSCPEQRRPELKPVWEPASPGSVASGSASTELPERSPLLPLQACFPSLPSQSKDLEQTAVSRGFGHPLSRIGGDLIWLSVPLLIRDQAATSGISLGDVGPNSFTCGLPFLLPYGTFQIAVLGLPVQSKVTINVLGIHKISMCFICGLYVLYSYKFVYLWYVIHAPSPHTSEGKLSEVSDLLLAYSRYSINVC